MSRLRRTSSIVLCLAVCISCSVAASEYERADKAYEEEHFELAAKLWQELAERGDPQSQFRLGRMYHAGVWFEQDLTKAAELYTLASSAGHNQASTELAQLYLWGKGVSRDTARGLRLLERASQRGAWCGGRRVPCR